MKGFDLITPGWNRSQLEEETQRVYEICDGCRRCFNLCPSFNTLFDRIDSHDGNLAKLSAQDYEQVEKECYYCKLCYNHCPYTSPHPYEIDFPRLMAAWKKQRTLEQGVSLRDKLLTKTDLIGKLGTLTSPLSNWGLKTSWVRTMLESVLGIHRNRQVLPFGKEPFQRWWKRRKSPTTSAPSRGKVALFPSCLVNFQATDVGKATIRVLEKNEVEILIPEGQRCCGMPSFDLGDTESMIQAAKHHTQIFLPYLERGYDIVVPAPSCSLMFKREYPYLCPDADINRMAQHTFDVCEYLMNLKRQGQLCLDFPHNPGRVAYQIPCHLRDQNIGFKSMELMELTGAQVRLIERCSGHDGTWGAKVEFFDLSMGIAKKATREIEDSSVDLVVSDCPLSCLQLDQARSNKSSGAGPTLHPIQVVRDAYGLSS